jgi:hypothetical protein
VVLGEASCDSAVGDLKAEGMVILGETTPVTIASIRAKVNKRLKKLPFFQPSAYRYFCKQPSWLASPKIQSASPRLEITNVPDSQS